ncbi:MAG TPA: hypothetical protein VKB84_23945 [Candidatus Binataceae bacterium]|nr:hypothetical protein [Candidatus Binataceae bacterium]
MWHCIRVAGLSLLVTAAFGCAAHRNYRADSQSPGSQQPAAAQESGSEDVARQQAVEVTASIGDRTQVKNQARQAAGVLKGLLALVTQLPNANPHVVLGLTRDVGQLSSGLDAIADSRDDQQFTTAVFSMCEPESVQASERVGPLLIGLAARIRANPPAKVPSDQVATWMRYFDALGETLVRIPGQCRHAEEAIARAKAQVQVHVREGQPAPTIEGERHHEATMMLLCIAGGMLAPSTNRYPMMASARFGNAFQQCQKWGGVSDVHRGLGRAYYESAD